MRAESVLCARCQNRGVSQASSAAELVRARSLRRMKALATGLFLLAALIYVLTRWWLVGTAPAWVGYVNAAAEAGMVGALADWFAVTALFRRPLGLPIPHTAIIPTRKNSLGRNLGDFVGGNFLSEQVVVDKLDRAGIASRAGEWLTDRDNAERATTELAAAARGAVQVLRDEEVRQVLEQVVLRKVVDQPWGPPLGRILGRVLEDGSHRGLVDLVCDRAYEWVRDNYETVSRVVNQRSPSWSPRFFDSMVADRVYSEVLSFAWAVRTDPEHRMRAAVDRFLIEFATDLREDPVTMARADRIKHQILEHPEVRNLLGSAWTTAKRMFLEAAEDPDSELRTRVREGLRSFGGRLASEPELREKVDGWLREAARYVVTHYRSEITTLITDTVERWDASEASDRIELHVGRDLQFIRINGTVVGALAGLAIHTVTHLLL
ncbi:Uncharacterized membrane-anchored protein YjiN, DUF445 family [Actinopolyspora saharensis]|uniref:Uncharacterized membrane-anchored protein YjiN, DUF445 family n=2 Tax=Actinopolyspora saharensis TaxID=995062 RepID=A0A1H1GB58_9ACTN|nr:Uncharacterized membrane-anchored protein YjiN, DUF445 family [Actinopolyspora saharensis]